MQKIQPMRDYKSLTEVEKIMRVFDTPYEARTISVLHDLPDDALRHIFIHLSNEDQLSNHRGQACNDPAASLPLAMTCTRMLNVYYSSLTEVEISRETSAWPHCKDQDVCRFVWRIGRFIKRLKLGLFFHHGCRTIDAVSLCCPRLRELDISVNWGVSSKMLVILFLRVGCQLTTLRLSAEWPSRPTHDSPISGLALCALGRTATNLQHLFLDNLCGVTQYSLVNLFSSVGKNLHTLGLSGFSEALLAGNMVEKIAKRCSHLMRLDIANESGIDQNMVFSFVNNCCASLQSIQLAGPDGFGGTLFGLISERCSELRRLTVTQDCSDWLLNRSFGCIWGGGDLVAEISLSGIPTVCEKTLEIVASRVTGLERVHISSCGNVDGEGIAELCVASRMTLRCLKLEQSKLGSCALHKIVRECVMLEEVHFTANRRLTHYDLGVLFFEARGLREFSMLDMPKVDIECVLGHIARFATRLESARFDEMYVGHIKRARERWARLRDIEFLLEPDDAMRFVAELFETHLGTELREMVETTWFSNEGAAEQCGSLFTLLDGSNSPMEWESPNNW